MAYTVGQVVGIIRTGSWNVLTEGKYTVTKANKVRIELTHVTSGRVRTFSTRSGNEFVPYGSSMSFIVPEAEYYYRVAALQVGLQRQNALTELKAAVDDIGQHSFSTAEIAKIRAALDAVEKFAITI